MQNYKKKSIQIIKNLKGNCWISKKELKFFKNLANQHGKDVAVIKNSFDKCSKSYKVAMFINYIINKTNKFGNVAYNQIAHICNCSWQLVEKVVKKMSAAGLIKHELNKDHKSNNLGKKFKAENKCNPFKWIFKWLKEFTGELSKIFTKSKGWIGYIHGSKVNLKYKNTLPAKEPDITVKDNIEEIKKRLFNL